MPTVAGSIVARTVPTPPLPPNPKASKHSTTIAACLTHSLRRPRRASGSRAAASPLPSPTPHSIFPGWLPPLASRRCRSSPPAWRRRALARGLRSTAVGSGLVPCACYSRSSEIGTGTLQQAATAATIESKTWNRVTNSQNWQQSFTTAPTF